MSQGEFGSIVTAATLASARMNRAEVVEDMASFSGSQGETSSKSTVASLGPTRLTGVGLVEEMSSLSASQGESSSTATEASATGSGAVNGTWSGRLGVRNVSRSLNGVVEGKMNIS